MTIKKDFIIIRERHFFFCLIGIKFKFKKKLNIFKNNKVLFILYLYLIFEVFFKNFISKCSLSFNKFK